MMKAAVILLAGLAAFATPALANAQTESRTVQIGDLDLNKPAGVAALDRRIDRAARQICATGFPRALWEQRADAACRADVAASATGGREAALAAGAGGR